MAFMGDRTISSFERDADPGPLFESDAAQITGAVGLIANPASARDVRRLVADGSAVTTNDKANLIRRLMVGLGRAGVKRVFSMTDLSGLSASLERSAASSAAYGWPQIEFLDHEITQTAADTRTAVKMMLETGVGALIVLGGDGTNRIVAEICGDVPLLSVSTGTNNAFPKPVDPTVAGIAAGLIATGRMDSRIATRRVKTLTVEHRGLRHHALVDVAITSDDNIGAGAVWRPESLRELFLCFAEPSALGLSSVGGHLQPVGRNAPHGLHIRFGPGWLKVSAPIAPGLVPDLDVAEFRVLDLNAREKVSEPGGVIAIDGERGFRFDEGEPVFITLGLNGPLAVDVDLAMNYAAEAGLLVERACQRGTPAKK